MIAAPQNPPARLAPFSEAGWPTLPQAADFLLREHAGEVVPYADPARPTKLRRPHAVALIRKMHEAEPLPLAWESPATGRIEPLPPGSQVLWHDDTAGLVLYDEADPGGRWPPQRRAGRLRVSRDALAARVADLPERRADAERQAAEADARRAARAAEVQMFTDAMNQWRAEAAREAEEQVQIEAAQLAELEAALEAGMTAASTATEKPPTRRARKPPSARSEHLAVPPWPPIRADTPAPTAAATEAIRCFLDDEGIQERVHTQREDCLNLAAEAAGAAAAQADDEAGGDHDPPSRKKLGRLWREQVALRRRRLGLPDETEAGPE